MEQAKSVTLMDGTVVEADPNRPYVRFLKITKGPVTVRMTLTDASAIYGMLGEYFAQPEVTQPDVRSKHADATAININAARRAA